MCCRANALWRRITSHWASSFWMAFPQPRAAFHGPRTAVITTRSEAMLSIVQTRGRAAMLAVVAVTLALTQTLFVPDDAEVAAEAAFFSLFSLANVYFWKFLDVSYFAASTDEQPFLHLWSLGVEEQFYIIWHGGKSFSSRIITMTFNIRILRFDCF